MPEEEKIKCVKCEEYNQEGEYHNHHCKGSGIFSNEKDPEVLKKWCTKYPVIKLSRTEQAIQYLESHGYTVTKKD